MNLVLLLPGATGTLNLCACLGYLYIGDWKRSVYWLCACLMTAMMTL